MHFLTLYPTLRCIADDHSRCLPILLLKSYTSDLPGFSFVTDPHRLKQPCSVSADAVRHHLNVLEAIFESLRTESLGCKKLSGSRSENIWRETLTETIPVQTARFWSCIKSQHSHGEVMISSKCSECFGSAGVRRQGECGCCQSDRRGGEVKWQRFEWESL